MNQIENILNTTEASSLITVFEHSVEPILMTNTTWDKGLQIIYANKAFCDTTGYTKDELLGQNPKIFQGKDSNQKILKELKIELLKGNHFEGQSINYRKDNTSYIVRWSISPLRDKGNNVVAYISFQKTIERLIHLEHDELLNAIVNTSENLILVTDLEGNITYLNDAFNKKLGYAKDELIGKHSRILKSGMQNELFYKNMWESIIKTGTFSDIFISRTKNGSLFYDKKIITTIKDIDGNPIYYVSTSTDITNQINKQKNLESQVYIDSLTETYNKKKYEEVIEEQIKNYTCSGKVFSLILIDIDFFKNINDLHGHDIGDYILRQFSKLIKENIRSDDLLFRWGGEEFAIILQNNQENAYLLAEKLRIEIANNDFDTIHITSSFGISQISENMDKTTLFSNADKALYKAKHNGRDQVQIF